MDESLRIAEEIYCKVRDEQGFSSDYFEDLNNLIFQIKEALRDTKLKLKYEFKDLDDLIDQVSEGSGKRVDLSLMPDRNTNQEFILWFARVIDAITDVIEPMVPQTQGDSKPIKHEPIDNGEDLMVYLKYEEVEK